MKSSKLVSIIILVVIALFILPRLCKEETNYEQEFDKQYDELDDVDNTNKIESDQDYGSGSLKDWPDSIYSTVQEATYLTQIEKDVIIEHNKCRTNPKRYISEVLEPFLDLLDNYGYFTDSNGRNIKTNEGRPAVEEAINELSTHPPMPMIRPKEYLYKAALDHCKDHGPKSLVGHDGSDGSSPMSRVKRYHSNTNGIGENIAYGPMSGVEIVRDLIIDDGVPSRGHRKNIFSEYRYIGCAYGKHAGFKTMCVIDYEM